MDQVIDQALTWGNLHNYPLIMVLYHQALKKNKEDHQFNTVTNLSKATIQVKEIKMEAL
jgi:hypothetical protein